MGDALSEVSGLSFGEGVGRVGRVDMEEGFFCGERVGVFWALLLLNQ